MYFSFCSLNLIKCLCFYRLLDPAYSAQFDNYKTVYADVLYRWNLLEQRAQVLKTVSASTKKHTGIGKIYFLKSNSLFAELILHQILYMILILEFLTECQHCKKDGTSVQCQSCKKFSFVCVICCVAVKGQ